LEPISDIFGGSWGTAVDKVNASSALDEGGRSVATVAHLASIWFNYNLI
jgi:hypothetical protein